MNIRGRISKLEDKFIDNIKSVKIGIGIVFTISVSPNIQSENSHIGF